MLGKVIPFEEAIKQIPGPEGQKSAGLFTHGSLQVKIYAPRGTDTQSPHTLDEGYVVVQGAGEFVFGSQRQKFTSGDFLFVPAGVAHRFENFSADLFVWVIFYGPEGGEYS